MPAPAPMKPDEFRAKVADALMRKYGMKQGGALWSVHYFKDIIEHGLDAPAYDYANYGKLATDYPAYTAKRIWDVLSASYFIVKESSVEPTPPRR